LDSIALNQNSSRFYVVTGGDVQNPAGLKQNAAGRTSFRRCLRKDPTTSQQQLQRK
jgi:hypothetical protein